MARGNSSLKKGRFARKAFVGWIKEVNVVGRRKSEGRTQTRQLAGILVLGETATVKLMRCFAWETGQATGRMHAGAAPAPTSGILYLMAGGRAAVAREREDHYPFPICVTEEGLPWLVFRALSAANVRHVFENRKGARESGDPQECGLPSVTCLDY